MKKNMKKKMIVFYHSRDLDGVASAAVIRHLCSPHYAVELNGFDYGQEFPYGTLIQVLNEAADTTLVMVDVSLPPDEMEQLAVALGSFFIWIDHHKSANEACEKQSIAGLRLVGTAASALARKYFATKHREQMRPVPMFIELLSDYDVWNDSDQRAWQEEILPFQFGMRTMEGIYNPAAALWDKFFEAEGYLMIGGMCQIGKSVLAYQRQQNTEIMKRCAFEGLLWLPEGAKLKSDFKAIVCNSPFCNSQLFDGVYDPAKHALMVSFYLHASGKFVVSLYTTREDIDCADIAKEFGGGGHRKAAGFQCDYLPIVRLPIVLEPINQEKKP